MHASSAHTPDDLLVGDGDFEDEIEIGADRLHRFGLLCQLVFRCAGTGEVLRHAGRIAFKNNVRTSIENEVHRVLKDAEKQLRKG